MQTILNDTYYIVVGSISYCGVTESVCARKLDTAGTGTFWGIRTALPAQIF